MAWKVEALPGASITVKENGQIVFERWQIDRTDGPVIEYGDFSPACIAILDWIRAQATIQY